VRNGGLGKLQYVSAMNYYYSAQVNWPFTQSRDIVQEQS
jgi:hypothetical protein